jgi:hypothetical protein
MTCSLRKLHVPKAPAPDSHHIIPRAWQEFFAETIIVESNPRPVLWDRRTVEVCPNCHRRIHVALVEMMKAARSDDPLALKKAAYGGRRLTREQAVAYTGLTRYSAAGGSLARLQDAKLYGAQ